MGHLLDWSNLQADYERLGSQRLVAQLYGCSRKMVETAMRRQDITCKPRAGRTLGKWSDERREAFKAAIDTPEFKEAHRAALLKRFEEHRGPQAGSPLEALLHGALKRAGVSFTTQRRKLDKYVVDIELLQAPIIIEADGLLHGRPSARARDAVRDTALTEAGYRVFRFTGTQINADPDHCVQTVITATGVTSDTEPISDIRRGGRGQDNPSWRGGQTEHTCTQCGSTFTQYRSNRSHSKKFCNSKCYGAWMRDHPEQSPVHTRWAKHRAQQVVA